MSGFDIMILPNLCFYPPEKHKISIKITDLKKSSVFEAAEAQAKLKAEKYEEGEISDSSRQSSSHSLSDTNIKKNSPILVSG